MRLIDADWMLEHKYKELCCYDTYDLEEMLECVPTVEQKHGHWIVIEKDVMGCTRYECSNCGKTDDDYTEPIFCKHCGCANGKTEKTNEVTE